MIRMKSFWFYACMLLFSTGMAFGQGAVFQFGWTDTESPGWYALDYCDSAPGLGVTLQDGTPVRLMKDMDNSTFSTGTYSIADIPVPIGSLGSQGQVDVNEWTFNSGSIPRAEGSFLSPTIRYQGGVPPFQIIYMLAGCYRDTVINGIDTSLFYPMWASQAWNVGAGPNLFFIGCPTGGSFPSNPGGVCWTRVGCCEPPPQCEAVQDSLVRDFQASDTDCDSIRMTWKLYDSTATAVLGYECVDSLVIKQGTTKIGSVVWSDTTFSYYPPSAATDYSFSIHVKRCCSDVILSDGPSDMGRRPRKPQGTPTMGSASDSNCDSVVVEYVMPGSTQSWDSTALLRNGVIVAWAPEPALSQPGTIVHHNAPMGQATYTVAGWNHTCGIGDQSSGDLGEAIVAPPEVQNVRATNDDCTHPTYTAITWNDLNLNETGYRVYRDGVRIAQVGANTTSYNDNQGSPAPAQGVVYDYSVRAYNSCDSSHTVTVDSGSLPILPFQVLNFAASDTLCDRIHLSWDPVTNTVITGYAVIKSLPAPAETVYVGPSTTQYDFFDTLSTATSPVVPLTAYTFKVAAANPCGLGLASATNTGTRQRKPNPVTNLVAGTSTCVYARISWSQTGITNEKGFKIFRDAVEIDTAGVNAVSYNDSSATPGFAHSYTVAAFNQCGDTTAVGPIVATRLAPPEAPANFLATDAACGMVTCTWDDVTGETGYTVHREDGMRVETTFPVGADITTYDDNTAIAGTIYSYWVTATNSCGVSGNSTADDGALLPLPGQPVIVSDSASCEAVYFCWNFLSEVDSFNVFDDGVFIGTTTDTCFTYAVDDSLDHNYQVVAYNDCGHGDSSLVTTLARLGMPGLPMQFGALVPNCDNISLLWTDDGIGVDGYILWKGGAYLDSLELGDTTYVDTNVAPGGTGTYVLFVYNECATLPVAEIGGSRLAPPTLVTDVEATDDVCAQVTITWTDPNSTEEGFKIVRDNMVARSVDTVATITDPDATIYNDLTAVAGTWYRYTVYAFNECGLSDPSEADSGIVLPLPAAITGFTAAEECSLIVMNWDPSEFAVSYRVYQDLGTLIGTVNDTTFAWDDLGQHNWHVIPANTCGAGVSSDTLNRTALTAPEDIVDLMANDDGGARTQVDNCDHVTLTWTDPANADTIFIYRDDTEIGHVLFGVETYTDDMLTPADYEYYVIANNECGETGESNHVNATVYPPPTTPTNVVASDTSCAQVYVTWDASTGTFDEYIIYADDTEIARVGAGTIAYSQTTAVPGVTAVYKVSAYDDVCGETELSAGDDGIRLEGPSVPADVVASDDLCDRITLTWTASTGTFTEYRIYRNSVLVGTVDGATTTFDDDTLSASGTYSYTLTAWSAECGETLHSTAVDGTMLPQMGQVTGLVASDDVCDEIQLEWDAYEGADWYLIYRANGLFDSVAAPATNYTDALVFPGDNFPYEIAAKNPCNEGPRSAIADGTAKDVPAAIMNLTATSTMCDEICLTWDDVEEETKYYVYRDTELYDSTLVDVAEYCDMTVVAGQTYNYVVRAKNDCGEGDPSESIPGMAIASLAQVQNVITTPSCDDVCISWDDIADETGYQLYYSIDGSTWIELAQVAADILTYCDAAIGAGECREYTVAGMNICGVGVESAQIEGCRLDVPIIVPNVVASTNICDSVLISWDDVGTETNFEVIRNSESLVNDLPENTTSYYDNTAVPNVTYTYTVRGINACGNGLPSEETFGMAADIPAQVMNVVASADQCSLVTVTWDDLTTETGYEVYSGSDPYTLLGTTDVDIVTFDAVGFIGADNFTVVALNQCGSGLRSDPATGEGLDVPPVVTNLDFTINCGTVTLTWDFPASADAFKVLRRADGATDFDTLTTTDLSSHSDTPGVGTWDYAVLATNECGYATGISNIVSVEIIPALAQVLNLTASTDSCNCVYLSWDDVDNETWYEIFRDAELVATTVLENNTDTVLCDVGTAASYQVRARNDCDTGPFSDAAIGSFDTIPAMVTGVSASEDNCNNITVIWDPVEECDGYIVYCDGVAIDTVESTADEIYEHVVDPGTYEYYIVAYNHCGNSTPSATDSGTRHDFLTAPADVTASTDRCDGIVIDFTPVPGAVSYTIFRIAFPITGITDADLPYTDVPDAPGDYTYTVAVVNICGQGFPSDPPVTGTMLESPGTPGNFTASDDMCDTIRFNWTVPTGAVDGYQILCNEVIVANIDDGSQTTFDLLDAGTVTCTYSITAISNGEGCVSSDPATDEGTSHDVPGAPQNLGTPLTPVCDLVALTWQAADGEVENYVIYRDELELEPIGIVANDIFEYSDTQVDDPNDHQYWVTATNFCGESDPAGPVTASILPLFEFEEDIPDTVYCVDQTVELDVRFCDNIDSLVIWMAVDGGGFDTLVAVVTQISTPATIVIPDIGRIMVDAAQVMVLSYRGARIDTALSNEFVVDCVMDADEYDLLIPQDFYLAQNYPNPFNPETTIEFGVPHQALVTIEIFDVLGRRVATPVASQLEPGIHTILWSCDNCATGMYIVRMVSENKVFHHKMLMLK